jgi:hypothetical protein
MVGRMEHVEGDVSSTRLVVNELIYTVAGLQAILEKFKGQRVSIVVEEIEEK